MMKSTVDLFTSGTAGSCCKPLAIPSRATWWAGCITKPWRMTECMLTDEKLVKVSELYFMHEPNGYIALNNLELRYKPEIEKDFLLPAI